MSNAVEIMQDSGRSMQPAAGGRGALTPADMLAHAVTNNASLDVVEKMMALQERWEANQARKAFDDAMARLRQNMPAIVKDKEVDFTTSKGRTHYRYEDLNSVTAAISPVMADLGLSFRWRTDNNSSGVRVTCVITHRDGHYEETSLSAPLDASGNKNAIQAIGSATTYLQRYTLKAALGLAAAVDDDGAGGPDQRTDERPARQEKQEQQQTASKADSRDTYARLSAANRAIQTLEQWEAFPKDQQNAADYASLPDDWKARFRTERKDKRVDLEAQAVPADDADPFGLPPANAERADAAPIEPEAFIAEIEAEFASCDSLEALDEAWAFRDPESVLSFPPDLQKARVIYVDYQRRLGRRV